MDFPPIMPCMFKKKTYRWKKIPHAFEGESEGITPDPLVRIPGHPPACVRRKFLDWAPTLRPWHLAGLPRKKIPTLSRGWNAAREIIGSKIKYLWKGGLINTVHGSEFRLTSWGWWISHYLQGFSTIPGGAGCLNHQQYVSRRVKQPFNGFFLNHWRQMIGLSQLKAMKWPFFKYDFGLPPPTILDQGSWNLTLTFHCLEAWCQDNVWWCELSAIILLLGIIPFSTLYLNSKKKSRDRPKLSSTPSLSHHFVWKNGECEPFSAHHSAVCRFFRNGTWIVTNLP